MLFAPLDAPPSVPRLTTVYCAEVAVRMAGVLVCGVGPPPDVEQAVSVRASSESMMRWFMRASIDVAFMEAYQWHARPVAHNRTVKSTIGRCARKRKKGRASRSLF